VAWVFRRRDRQQEQQQQQPFGFSQIGAIVQADWDMFLSKFVNPSVQRLGLESPIESKIASASREQTSRVLSVFVTPANITVPTWSSEAFKLDMKRKVAALLKLFKDMADEDANELYRSALAYLEAVKTGDENAKKESVKSYITALYRLLASTNALLIALDALMGMVQANLPLHVMPNVPKLSFGYASQ
jgi:hypothetical protein